MTGLMTEWAFSANTDASSTSGILTSNLSSSIDGISAGLADYPTSVTSSTTSKKLMGAGAA